jgi:predicted transcriptional regulator
VKVDGRYQLTTTGQLVTKIFTKTIYAFSVIEENNSLLNCLPSGEKLPDPVWFQSADITIADPTRPHAPLDHQLQSLRNCSSSQIHEILPMLSRFHESIHAELLDRNIGIDVIFGSMSPRSTQDSWSQIFERTFNRKMFKLYRYESPITFGLVFTSKGVLIGSYDQHRRLRACVESLNANVVSWAEDLYESYRARSLLIDHQ